VIVLGVSFAHEKPANSLPALDVILVKASTDTKPKQADFLANASQRGGGEHDDVRRPRDMVSGLAPNAVAGIAPVPQRAASPRPTPDSPTTVLTGGPSEMQVMRPDPMHEARKLPEVNDREMIERSMEMARLQAEIARQAEAYAKRPRRKFISANTKEYEFADYMRAWVARVERIGNLNYPAEARTRELSGQLVLTVAVRKDGSVERVDVIQGSGIKLLDEAAQRIVSLSAPFPPLPKSKDEVDVLHITRTWQFLPGGIHTE
jgi:protein TonB